MKEVIHANLSWIFSGTETKEIMRLMGSVPIDGHFLREGPAR